MKMIITLIFVVYSIYGQDIKCETEIIPQQECNTQHDEVCGYNVSEQVLQLIQIKDSDSNDSIQAGYMGTCQKYLEFINSELVKNYAKQTTLCQDPRQQVCDTYYKQTCGFKQIPCYSSTCTINQSNGCFACSESTIKGYIEGISCEEYLSNLQNGKVIPFYYTCLSQRPTECNNDVDTVCGIKMNCDNNCEIEFNNACLSCTNIQIGSYYKGKCLMGYLLNIIFELLFLYSLII